MDSLIGLYEQAGTAPQPDELEQKFLVRWKELAETNRMVSTYIFLPHRGKKYRGTFMFKICPEIARARMPNG
jgi:hypothetical protein